MPFIETEASVRYEIINGKRVPVITPKTEVTLTNTETGQEYMSDAEAMQMCKILIQRLNLSILEEMLM